MTDIVIEDVTTGTIDGTGIFDKLMVSVKSHIQEEYDKGRLKGTDYANVYLGVMQSVLSQSIQYALQEKQTEAQIDLTIAQTAEVLDGTIRANTQLDDQLLTSEKQRVLLDEEKETADAQQLILAKELLAKSYEVDTLLPDQHTTNLKQQILLDTEEEAKQYEIDNILPLQKGKAEEDVKLVYVTRVGKDKEVAGMGLDLVTKGNNATPPSIYTPKYEV